MRLFKIVCFFKKSHAHLPLYLLSMNNTDQVPRHCIHPRVVGAEIKDCLEEGP